MNRRRNFVITKAEVLAVFDARWRALRDKYVRRKLEGIKYLTREEAESDWKEIASAVEFVVEQIKIHGTNPHEDRKTANDIWDAYLDAYKKVKGLFKAPDKKAQEKIRKNEAKLAALQKKIAKMEKDFEDRFGFPPPR